MNMYSIKQLLLKTSILVGLVLLLAACTGGNSPNGTGSNATPTTQSQVTATTGVAATSTPSIGLGSQHCPAAVSSPAHWNALIPTQANVTEVVRVLCGNLKGTPTLQALVTVLHDGTGAIVDAYVYDNLTSATPTQIFKVLNLYKGDAKISGYNTVITAEVDLNSSVNVNKPGVALNQDLTREFKWSDGAGTLVQIIFSGIFPDLTRYQAEADQVQVNQGQQSWKLSATTTAQNFGARLLTWDSNAPATIVSGGGQGDAQAVVKLKNTTAGSQEITLTMSRLEGNTNGGIWIITAVAADGMSITQPQSASLLSTPATVTGMGNAFEGVVGPVTILDHLYADIGHVSAHGAAGNGNTTFSASVSYKTTFKGGAEEGLVMLAAANNASGGIGAVVMVKVLIQ